MEQSLRKIFSMSEDKAGDEPEDDEDLYDIGRAYGLLLHASGVIGSPEHEDASHEVNMWLTITMTSVDMTFNVVCLFVLKFASCMQPSQLLWTCLQFHMDMAVASLTCL